MLYNAGHISYEPSVLWSVTLHISVDQ